jgi:hypothetical protein
MQPLVELIVKALVDQPELVSVALEEGPRSAVIQVRVAPEDLGKVIGRNGRIANSLRTLVRAAGSKEGKSYWVNFDQTGSPEEEAPPPEEEI